MNLKQIHRLRDAHVPFSSNPISNQLKTIKGSLGYIIKCDDIDYFEELAETDGFELDQVIDFETCFRNIMEYAAECGSLNIFFFLTEKNCDITKNVVDFALTGGCIDILKIIYYKKRIDFGKSINVAVEYCQNEVVDWIMDYFPSHDPIDIFKACFNGNIEAVYYCLSNGVDINTKNEKGEIPLHLACTNGSLPLVQFLVNNGADVNASNYDGYTPLYLACVENRQEIAQFLFERGAYIDPTSEVFEEVMLYASLKGFNDIVLMFLRCGGEVNRDYEEYSTLLHNACKTGNEKLATDLLYMGADARVVNENGQTPLHCACLSGSMNLIELLLKFGSPINSIDKNELTPLHLAKRMGHDEVASFLEQRGGICYGYF